MIRFNLDKNVSLSFYDQIKGQLLSAIYCGKLKQGDRLPSIRELSEDLGVNYKTIRRIYQCLAQENYIELIQGSGAFLKKRSDENTYEQMRRRAIYKLISEVAEKARGLGIPPQKFARLLESYTTGTNVRKLRLAVLDDEEEAFIFSRELELRVGAEVVALALKQLALPDAADVVASCDYILTTSYHLDEARQLAETFQKEVVEIKPSHDIYTEILQTARHKNVAIVIQDERTLHASWEIFMNIYYPSTNKRFWIAPIDRADLVDQIIREADLIFVSPMCWDEMRKKAPATKQLKTYSNFISEETISHLRELQLLG